MDALVGGLVYCYDCAAAFDAETLVCEKCGCSVLSAVEIAPSKYTEPDPYELAGPWRALRSFPPGSLVVLAGGPGSGKSSLAALLFPERWLTSEQAVNQATGTIAFIQGEDYEAPLIRSIVDPLDLENALEETFSGLVVLDSVSELGGPTEQEDAMCVLRTWVRGGPDRRGIAILGETKAGLPAGPRKLQHMGEVLAEIDADEVGHRRLCVRKNRHGPLNTRYFEITGAGVGDAQFPYAYSVEGPPGAYRFSVVPTKGAKWQDLIAARASDLGAGVAGVGRRSPHAPGGFIIPPDVAQRRAFAEAHDLEWVEVANDG